MKEVHVLVVHGGSYEDTWTDCICAGSDLIKMQALCREKNEQLEKARHDEDRINQFTDDWISKNPYPVCPPLPVTYQLIPKWESIPGVKQVITQEMRDERKAIQDENKNIIKATMEPYHREFEAHAVVLEKAVNEFIANNKLIKPEIEDAGWYQVVTVPMQDS